MDHSNLANLANLANPASAGAVNKGLRTELGTEPRREFPCQTALRSESKVAVLIPCLNEELTIGQVVLDFKAALPSAQIYVFDNNSTDRTAEIAKEAGAMVIPSPIQGKGNVVRQMFDTVEADAYLMVDGDGTYPADAGVILIEKILSGKYSMAVGTRMSSFEKRSFRPLHEFGNHLVSTLIRSFFSTHVKDVLSGYRAFSREFVKTIPIQSDGFEIETEMTLQAVSKRFRITEVPIRYGVRPEGSHSKLSTYRDGALVLRSIFMILKDYRPLLFFSACSFLLVCLSLAAGWGPVSDYFRFQYVYHVPLAILSAALGILAVFFFCIGLILDTISKYQCENFNLWRRSLKKGSP